MSQLSTRTLCLGMLPVLLAAQGCFDLPDFAQSKFIDRPRILAVVAEPPEISPERDDALTLSVLTAGATEITDVRWTACGMPSTQVGGMGNQFGENMGDRGCRGETIPLGEGERITLDIAIARPFLMSDALASAALGAALPAAALQQIRESIGLAATAEVELLADGKRLRALKRVLVRDGENPSSNPPPPTLRFGDTLLRGEGDAPPFRCQPESGGLRVAHGAAIELEPEVEGDREPWLEDYMVLDARGVLAERSEQAFYSWFTDAGDLEDGMTQAPNRANTWTAPRGDGCATIWLIVRDGHAGATSCTVNVSVGDGPNSECEP
jgi:hypothetical protein